MTKEEFLKVCEMRYNHYTYQEIADELGCSKQHIHTFLKETLNKKDPTVHKIIIYPNLATEIKHTYRTVKCFCETKERNYRHTCDMLSGRVKPTLEDAMFFSELFDKDINYLFHKRERK